VAFDVETKDCTALSDAELTEMADICADGPAGFDVGLLSKQREEWVLITQVRDNGKLHGFAFSTLERIGGTPCVLVGLASVKRSSKRDAALKAVMNDLYRRGCSPPAEPPRYLACLARSSAIAQPNVTRLSPRAWSRSAK
jgi:hypothetical protein